MAMENSDTELATNAAVAFLERRGFEIREQYSPAR